MTNTYKERMEALADVLETNPKAFEYGSFGMSADPGVDGQIATLNHHCGAQFCIAGWAVLLAGGRMSGGDDEFFDKDGNEVEAPDFAREYLGLSVRTAHRLFYQLNIANDDSAGAAAEVRKVAKRLWG